MNKHLFSASVWLFLSRKGPAIRYGVPESFLFSKAPRTPHNCIPQIWLQIANLEQYKFCCWGSWKLCLIYGEFYIWDSKKEKGLKTGLALLLLPYFLCPALYDFRWKMLNCYPQIGWRGGSKIKMLPPVQLKSRPMFTFIIHHLVHPYDALVVIDKLYLATHQSNKVGGRNAFLQISKPPPTQLSLLAG